MQLLGSATPASPAEAVAALRGFQQRVRPSKHRPERWRSVDRLVATPAAD